ncbi:hypothetical protein DBV15_11632 [Temnothorax longispinosus]|uniref:Uncharacterized protein n=1 Tax=Temnothorax longispinosus TaxID=300112 RepID=A0A4S2KK71_9HYME|nr:hypothetical protein DBV15_11632 [Temnothorax longispinosus]
MLGGTEERVVLDIEDEGEEDGTRVEVTKGIEEISREEVIEVIKYIVSEEAKIKKIKMRAIRRAVRYEDKARQSEKKIVQACIKDLERSRPRKEESNWEKKRRELIERVGMEKEQLRREMEAGNREAAESLVKRLEEKEKERQIKINESRYITIKRF